MDRNNRDIDSVTGGRTLHTYTPKSHEDLLRSHLQLDASRNAKLQNELQRLADENKRLRRDLNDAEKEIKDKEDEIDDLRKKLREKPTPTAPQKYPSDGADGFELDGKPLTLYQILKHFDGVIEKHHDLLDKKNRQIHDLENALRNIPKQPIKNTRNAETQLEHREDDKEGLVKELTLIRKEYEQVEHILTDRNNKLENQIEDLRKKLDKYNDEIGYLRKELAAQKMDPDEKTIMLLKEKEKENNYLKNLINSLQKQPQTAILHTSGTAEPIKSYQTSSNEGPITRREEIITRIEEPIARNEEPIARNEDPIGRYEEPKARIAEPIARNEDPIGRYQDKIRSPDPSPESSLKSYRPVDYRPVSPEASYRQFPIKRERLYPDIPWETVPSSVYPSSKPYSHRKCEACEDDYYPSRTSYTPREDIPARIQHTPKQTPTRDKPKKKGCCGGKGSATSNVPYEKKAPQKEEIILIHQPEHPQDKTPTNSPTSKRKLVAKMKPDRH